MKVCPQCSRCFEDDSAKCSVDGAALVTSRHGTRDVAGGKYRLDRLLGRGGMGAVYAGTHVDLERPIAIKLLLPEFTDQPDALERFRREARAAARLNHPNVADTYDYGLLPEGGAYIVMELVDGINLREHLNRHARLPFDEIKSITRQVALGIEAAHRRGIVHRDLKPANIMLTHDAHDGLIAIVLDFGIAKLKEQTLTGALTNTGTLIGTPRYMSPEQCAGLEIDARSDIYALGVILYEMLTHRPPFDAATATAVALKHMQEPPPPITNLRPDAPADLVALCLKMLDKRPERRPQTAAAIAGALAAMTSPPSSQTDRTEPARIADGSASQAVFATQRTATAAATARRTEAIAQPTVSIDDTNRAGVPTAEESLAIDTSAVVPLARTGVAGRQQTPWGKLGLVAVAACVVSAGAFYLVSKRSSPAARAEPIQTTTDKTPREAATTGASAAVADRQNEPRFAAANDTNAAPTQTRDASPAESLRSRLDEWVAATNRGDIPGQMAFYAPVVDRYYRSRHLTPAAIESEKRKLFQPAVQINMTIGAVQINVRPDGRTATTRFHKRYEIRNRTSSRDGEVVQEIDWSLTPDGWKITGERDVRVIG